MYPHSFLQHDFSLALRAYRVTDWVDPNAPLVFNHLANSFLQLCAVDTSIEVMDEEGVAQGHYREVNLALPEVNDGSVNPRYGPKIGAYLSDHFVTPTQFLGCSWNWLEVFAPK